MEALLIYEEKCKIYTDHKSLKYLFTQKELNMRQRRCYVMVSDNDLSVLGYVSDYICCLYGLRGAYGVVCVAQDSEVFARRGLQGIVGELLDRKDETGMKAEICSELGINQILKRNLMRGSQQLGVKYSSLLGRLMSVQSRRTREKQTIRAERAGEVQYFIGVQLDGSKHVEPLQNSIPEATVKENSKLVKETAENIDEAVRELPDANSVSTVLHYKLLKLQVLV
ncbi:hypothetical protein AgCh_000076 [Apium graveolens]